jgi:hypothetical protein
MADMHDFSIFNHIILAFQPQLAFVFGLIQAAQFNQFLKRDHFSPDKSFGQIGMNGPGRLHGRGALADGPGPDFILPHRKKREESQ